MIAAILATATVAAKEKSYQPENYSYLRGVEQYSEENYADALDWFNKELGEHPDNGYAYWYIAAIKASQEEYGEAISAANAALKKVNKKDKSSISSIYQTRAKIYLSMADTIAALDDYGTAIKTDPADIDAWEDRADLLYKLERYDESDADYRKGLEIDNTRQYCLMGLGRNYAAREDWDNAIAQYSKVIKLYKDYGQGYSFRAEAYAAKEMWNEATEDILSALTMGPDQKALYSMLALKGEARDTMKVRLKVTANKDKKDNAWMYYLGILADNEENYQEAISYYQKAFEIDADPVLSYYISGCYKSLGDYTSALDEIDKAIQMRDDDTDYMSRRANILYMLTRYDEAITQIDKYIEAEPEDPNGYMYKAEYEYAKKDYEKAIDDYTTVSVLAPDYTATYLKRGQAYKAIGKDDLATKDFEKILAIDTAASSSVRAYALIRLGRADEARASLPKIIEADSIGESYNLACLYSLLGDEENAVRYLRETLNDNQHTIYEIQDDTDLDNIRDTQAYKDFVDEYARKHNIPEVRIVEDSGEADKGKTAAGKTDSDDTDDNGAETTEVPFTKADGVTKVKCTINGLPLSFVFDTGAAEVSISSVEANFMYKNGYITKDDIGKTAFYVNANGDISEGTVINLRKINFGGFELTNVRASVVHNQVAPLLLGQSVLGRLGRITIDNKNLRLLITHKKSAK